MLTITDYVLQRGVPYTSRVCVPKSTHIKEVYLPADTTLWRFNPFTHRLAVQKKEIQHKIRWVAWWYAAFLHNARRTQGSR